MDSSELKTASRHLLVDFENVNKIDGAVSSGEFQIKIFLGEQCKLKADFLNKILKTGHRIELIRISGNGPNALDFHIAFYLGILSDRHRGDAFFILSRDSGFDPLVRHLSSQGVLCRRIESLQAASGRAEKPAVAARKAPAKVRKPAPAPAPSKAGGSGDFLSACEEALRNMPAARRPKSRERLIGFLTSRLRTKTETLDVDAVMAHLHKQKFAKEENGKIAYLK
jgi:hypothetical protein